MLGRWFFLAVVGIGLVVIVRGPRSDAAQATIAQACAPEAPGVARVTFGWPTPPPGTEQAWLDLSLLPGFPPPLTNAHGPLPPSQRSYTVDALPVGVTLHYRVNTLAAAGWRVVAQGTFKTACAAPGAAATVTPTAA
ncbi:MAG: hypothetical protein KGK07_14300 [Chloroflexota bacterium]|nr:hypothetical protein [Chloroflexota bacterium]